MIILPRTYATVPFFLGALSDGLKVENRIEIGENGIDNLSDYSPSLQKN